jgi:hypothetical protein
MMRRTLEANSKIGKTGNDQPGYKVINMKPMNHTADRSLQCELAIKVNRSPSPEANRLLFSTGFIYKSNISPKDANFTIDNSLRIYPTVPPTQT